MAQRTPLEALARGLAAGVAGTTTMTAWQEISARLDGQGSEDASAGAAPPTDEERWERASAPAKVARLVANRVLHVDIPAKHIDVTTNVMHWAYGIGWGAPFGLLRRRARGRPVASGLAFGTFVWAMSYAQLVPLGIYEPPWHYSPKVLALDVSYHLAYGAGLGAGAAVLDR